MKTTTIPLFVIGLIGIILIYFNKTSNLMAQTNEDKEKITANKLAYFASGCFWCVEHIYESVIGVEKVVSGYSGGTKENANYRAVSSGKTNHAETVAVYYDSTKISYETLLIVFFASHDPSTLNQQGPDKGRHYRSAIFYANETEKKLAENNINRLLKEKKFTKITTEVSPFEAFYKAEDYHQDYKFENPNNSYIQCVSVPRYEAFKKQHPELLKKP